MGFRMSTLLLTGTFVLAMMPLSPRATALAVDLHATTTIYLPNIVKMLGGPDGWNTPFIVQNVGSPPGANCGRRLVKKTATFALPRLLSSP